MNKFKSSNHTWLSGEGKGTLVSIEHSNLENILQEEYNAVFNQVLEMLHNGGTENDVHYIVIDMLKGVIERHENAYFHNKSLILSFFDTYSRQNKKSESDQFMRRVIIGLLMEYNFQFVLTDNEADRYLDYFADENVYSSTSFVGKTISERNDKLNYSLTFCPHYPMRSVIKFLKRFIRSQGFNMYHKLFMDGLLDGIRVDTIKFRLSLDETLTYLNATKEAFKYYNAIKDRFYDVPEPFFYFLFRHLKYCYLRKYTVINDRVIQGGDRAIADHFKKLLIRKKKELESQPS